MSMILHSHLLPSLLMVMVHRALCLFYSSEKTRIKKIKTMGVRKRQRRGLSVEVVISTIVTEGSVSASANGTDTGGVTWSVGELEVVAERAGLLEILGEHFIPPDVGIRDGTASVFHGFLKVLPRKEMR